MKPSIIILFYLSAFVNQTFSLPQSNTRIKNSNGSWKPIYEVVKTGNENDIRELLAIDVNIDQTDANDNTALIWATMNGHKEAAKLLIQNGADINKVNKEGWTALIWASNNGQHEIVDLLIQKGANINHKNQKGVTALILAVKAGHKEVVDVLMQKGANPEYVDENGWTALILAAYKGFKEIVDLLIQKGANVDQTDRNGSTALFWAADQGHTDTVELLIQKGAKINLVNEKGNTPLVLAVQNEHNETAHFLIQKGANVNYTNESGWTDKGSVAQRACDLYSNLLSDRIFGGDFAEEQEFPWMAALGYLSQSYKIYFGCGGTVISDLFVLTAAHCVLDKRRPVVVRMGKLSLTDSDGTRPDNYQIREIIRHPNYSITEKKNDIALIRVLNRIWFSDFVRPACLQIDRHDMDTNIKLTVTGWGKISSQLHNISNTLRKTDLQTMPLSQCNTTLLEYNKGASQKVFRNGLGEGQYCAHDPINRSDSCEGDSGGPLQIIHPNVTLSKIVGVVSFGISCGTALPSIYTRVAYYLEWIETYVWPNDEISTPSIESHDE